MVDRLARRRHRSRARDAVHPVARARARRAHAAAGDDHAAGLARARADLQGPAGEARRPDLSTYGFLGYPLMQGADILIYRANMVPVGEDQVSHVEFTREIARRFNHIYGREPGFEEKARRRSRSSAARRRSATTSCAPRSRSRATTRRSKPPCAARRDAEPVARRSRAPVRLSRRRAPRDPGRAASRC